MEKIDFSTMNFNDTIELVELGKGTTLTLTEHYNDDYDEIYIISLEKNEEIIKDFVIGTDLEYAKYMLKVFEELLGVRI